MATRDLISRLTGSARKFAERTARRSYFSMLRPLISADERLLMAIGTMESRAVQARPINKLSDAEFRVFSQWGEDGIIQYLTSVIPIPHRRFVEFGVEDYRESNTRFLLQKDYWEGLILDGGTAHSEFLAQSHLRWRHTIDSRSVFLTAENINTVVSSAGMEGDIGLLSIDVDGNDYWLFKALDVVQPRILVIEYNSLFGPIAAVSTPYRADFTRAEAHWSGVYYGASLAALCHLADARGFSLVGCSRGGCNAFFVRRDVLGSLQPLTADAAFVQRQHREARSPEGRLTYLSGAGAQLQLIADMTVVDVTTGQHVLVRDLIVT